MIKNIMVCEYEDILAFGQEQKLGFWNGIIDWIFRFDEQAHRHWYLNSFIITRNFFNPKYQDDAYGLQWHPQLQDLVKKFMDEHKVNRFMVINCKNHSMTVL